jgi:hypothetical protein
MRFMLDFLCNWSTGRSTFHQKWNIGFSHLIVSQVLTQGMAAMVEASVTFKPVAVLTLKALTRTRLFRICAGKI